jgi:hypothetical protein
MQSPRSKFRVRERVVLVLMLVTVRRPPGKPQAGASMGSHEDKSVSVGDSAMIPALAMPAREPQGGSAFTLARPLPEKP